MNDSTFLNSNTTSNLNSTNSSNKNEELNSNKLEPSKLSINNVLNYSKAISMRKSEEIGFIENLLN